MADAYSIATPDAKILITVADTERAVTLIAGVEESFPKRVRLCAGDARFLSRKLAALARRLERRQEQRDAENAVIPLQNQLQASAANLKD